MQKKGQGHVIEMASIASEARTRQQLLLGSMAGEKNPSTLKSHYPREKVSPILSSLYIDTVFVPTHYREGM
ncbi:hypothetical protein [Pseudomonas piscis]|uniref:Uncharacterized protein n=1 Tax=Pseudomonas piscis TaxID=2614538 RepID=A0A7X1PRN3_9PSED|nr:hypothetical protein [Pseudomonas piscis]MQA52344.1 hypothetical protein [Pseudomonas piscis]MQA57186.1 hypothetical protein [Pseudomonas piscis]